MKHINEVYIEAHSKITPERRSGTGRGTRGAARKRFTLYAGQTSHPTQAGRYPTLKKSEATAKRSLFRSENRPTFA